ncbi:MAG: CBS domain-containing protein [Desulfuromonadales bacterium]|nr:CBS domain-containing protein [Desulfuromonadales bacterium]
MAEESAFFLPIKNFTQRQLVTCQADASLVEAAGLMREHDVSSLVVCSHGHPVGIFTDRDLRNKVVALGHDPNSLQVRSIMSAPLITVREDDFLFEALYQMSRNRIHRVCVIDAEGKLTGILTDSDILKLQSRSPQQMLRQIEEAETTEELATLHRQIQDLVLHMVGTGVSTRNLVRMIAHLNDRLQIRLIDLLRQRDFPDLTDRFAFVVLGSEGRREQTLATDQDNAIIYADDLSPAQIERIEAFSETFIAALIAVGIPACPGGIMAKNPFWRRSLSDWSKVVGSWLSTPTSQNILNGSMYFDLRTLYGDPQLETQLKALIAEQLSKDAVFLAHTGANVLGFKPPIGWFGHLQTESKGEYRGQLDIKKAGIFAITEGIKVLALEAGIFHGGTRERLLGLTTAGVLHPEQAQNLEASFDFLVFLRLRSQVRSIREGRKPGNHLNLDHLNRMETGRLKLALEEVRSFQSFLKRHFRIDLLLG